MKKLFLKNIKISNLFFSLFAASYILAVPVLVYAQQKDVDYQTQQDRCKKFASYITTLVEGLPQFCTMSELLAFVLERLLWLSGSVAVLFIIVGGFFYLSAAGNEEQSEKGKKILMNSIVGLIIIVMATAIVRIVSGTLKGG